MRPIEIDQENLAESLALDIETVYQRVVEGSSLNESEAQILLMGILSEKLNPLQITAALSVMKTRTETALELSGFVRALRQQLGDLPRPKEKLLDNCGTGGDKRGTFNVSTTAMFVAAAAGVKIAKHGNRAMTSQSGAADVLESLKIQLNATPQTVKNSIETCGVGFYFAPAYHEAMKTVAPIRRTLGFRTIFNLVGPLSNPVGAEYQMVGVFNKEVMDLVADALIALGVERAIVVHGEDGLDEITSTGVTHMIETNGKTKTAYTIRPDDFGLDVSRPESLKGGLPQENATRLIGLLKGEGTQEDKTLIALNAGAAIYLYGCEPTLYAGVHRALEILETDLGYQKLCAFQKSQGAEDSILEKICKAKMKRVEAAKRERPLNEVMMEALEKSIDYSQHHAFKKALSKQQPPHHGQKIHVIAEIKQASPSKGTLRVPFDPLAIAKEYEEVGASAISVLTEEDYFKGSSEILQKLSRECTIPILRKDFILDAYQIYESKTLGASAILLIAQLLEKEQLKEFVQIAHHLGMDVLLEIHDAAEIEKALYSGARMIGINNRDLKTFHTTIEKGIAVINQLPSSCMVISESGIHSSQAVERLCHAGFNGILVGEFFMRAECVKEAFLDLVSGVDGN